MSGRTLIRFAVEVYDPEVDDWESKGSVLLPDQAPEHEVEHALAALGLYAPRGADVLEWDQATDFPYAMITDASGTPMVRMADAKFF